jgi:hypothetical protein
MKIKSPILLVDEVEPILNSYNLIANYTPKIVLSSPEAKKLLRYVWQVYKYKK